MISVTHIERPHGPNAHRDSKSLFLRICKIFLYVIIHRVLSTVFEHTHFYPWESRLAASWPCPLIVGNCFTFDASAVVLKLSLSPNDKSVMRSWLTLKSIYGSQEETKRSEATPSFDHCRWAVVRAASKLNGIY